LFPPLDPPLSLVWGGERPRNSTVGGEYLFGTGKNQAMKIISITIATVLFSTAAMAMGNGDSMKASPNPSPAAHAPAQHPHHPAVVHKHKKHG
jgi:hypothetical protein